MRLPLLVLSCIFTLNPPTQAQSTYKAHIESTKHTTKVIPYVGMCKPGRRARTHVRAPATRLYRTQFRDPLAAWILPITAVSDSSDAADVSICTWNGRPGARTRAPAPIPKSERRGAAIAAAVGTAGLENGP